MLVVVATGVRNTEEIQPETPARTKTLLRLHCRHPHHPMQGYDSQDETHRVVRVLVDCRGAPDWKLEL